MTVGTASVGRQTAGTAVSPLELLGDWTLERRILDRRSGLSGRVEGSVEFRAAGEDVRWLERGTLTWDGRRVEVTRELMIVATGTGWTVRFADGRDFHPWAPGDLLIHPCRADVYRGTVVVDRAGQRLRMLWDATGPAKDQRLVTRCRRRPTVSP